MLRQTQLSNRKMPKKVHQKIFAKVLPYHSHYSLNSSKSDTSPPKRFYLLWNCSVLQPSATRTLLPPYTALVSCCGDVSWMLASDYRAQQCTLLMRVVYTLCGLPKVTLRKASNKEERSFFAEDWRGKALPPTLFEGQINRFDRTEDFNFL